MKLAYSAAAARPVDSGRSARCARRCALRGFFGGSDERPRPKICPACGALVGISATRCHECGTSLRFSLVAMGKSLGATIGGETPVTTSILILNLLLFGVSLVATNQG